MRHNAGFRFAVGGATLGLVLLLPGAGASFGGGVNYPPVPGPGGGVTPTTAAPTTTTAAPTTTTIGAFQVPTTTRAPTTTTHAVVPTKAPVIVVQKQRQVGFVDAAVGGGVLSRTGMSITLPILALASIVLGVLLWAAARRKRPTH